MGGDISHWVMTEGSLDQDQDQDRDWDSETTYPCYPNRCLPWVVVVLMKGYFKFDLER